MRLINCSTLEFEEFIGKQIPPYAILSHTWDTHEISFKDYCSPAQLRQKRGSEKILMTCELALQDGYQYAWIDTCCIDRSSSQELTEAVNSMFTWYKRSERCYVYLYDYHRDEESFSEEELSRCWWFTRGWTLQELIAPRDVRFYDSQWLYMDTKHGLLYPISRITEIYPAVIDNSQRLSDFPVAARMAWAARRETAREEDIAYCLLGIFNVNMPVLYGEGRKAFIRLQEEILKQTNDLSLFAWKSEQNNYLRRGILARSPREFAGFTLSATEVASAASKTTEYRMTNKGLRLETGVVACPRGTFFLPISGWTRLHTGIMLGTTDKEQYYRAMAHDFQSMNTVGRRKNKVLYIVKDVEQDED